MQLKQAFIEKYSGLTDFNEYIKYINQFRRKSIRVNTVKTTVHHVKKSLQAQGWQLQQVPWCNEGFYVEGERRDIGNTAEHKQGHIFVQRSTSMLASCALAPKKSETVLDMCAAPGGKTTHLASLMQNTGVIIANEPVTRRLRELHMNLQRCGVINTAITQQSGTTIKEITFDKIMLDAPCSNSGSLRGNTKQSKDIMKTWNKKLLQRLSYVQKKLLLHAYSLLKPKGTLVYATCSLDPEEDEYVVDHLLAKTDAKLLPITLNVKIADKKYGKIWPQYQDTDGFFFTRITKP